MKKHISIGDRVAFNGNVAFAFIGQFGTVESVRRSPVDGLLWTIRLETPTPAATDWPPLETLAVTAECLWDASALPKGTTTKDLRLGLGIEDREPVKVTHPRPSWPPYAAVPAVRS